METKKIIIIGGGGHAKVVIDTILSQGVYEIEGIVDPGLKVGETILGVPVLGGDEILEDAAPGMCLALGMGMVKASEKRKSIYERYAKKFSFPPIIHKSCLISPSATYGNGVQMIQGAIVQPGVKIGENVILNVAAIIGHDSVLDPHCHIAVNAVVAGGVKIGECSHIGMGARILQGITIGHHAMVGAGAVVTKDVPDGATVCGMPARVVRVERSGQC